MPAGCAQRSLKPEMILMGCHVWSSGSGSAQYFVGTWVTAGPPWLAPLLAVMQDRQGEHCSALNHVKGPCGDRQTCDLELEKACDSQALGIIHRDGSKPLWELSRSINMYPGSPNKPAQPPVLNRPIKQTHNNEKWVWRADLWVRVFTLQA